VCLINFNKAKMMTGVVIGTGDRKGVFTKRCLLILIISAGFPYKLDRLMPRASQFRGPRAKVYNVLTLLLDFHTNAVIAHCTF
jgi:hypothetical protein